MQGIKNYNHYPNRDKKKSIKIFTEIFAGIKYSTLLWHINSHKQNSQVMKTEKLKCSICGCDVYLSISDGNNCFAVCSEACNNEALLRIKMGANPALYQIK